MSNRRAVVLGIEAGWAATVGAAAQSMADLVRRLRDDRDRSAFAEVGAIGREE